MDEARGGGGAGKRGAAEGEGEGAGRPGSCLVLSGLPNVCDREPSPAVNVGDLENVN